MPIYEFYCQDCNTIFNFFSRRVNTEKVPSCPRCKRPELRRVPSSFGIAKRAEEGGGDDMPFPDLDESKMMDALATLEKEAGALDEEDPRQAARLMRKLTDMTGLNLGSRWEEAMERLEAGESPDEIEEELGDLLEEEEPFVEHKRRVPRSKRPPKRDDTLYEL